MKLVSELLLIYPKEHTLEDALQGDLCKIIFVDEVEESNLSRFMGGNS